jgi:hypothetical protein
VEPAIIEYKYNELGHNSQKTYDYFNPNRPKVIVIHDGGPSPYMFGNGMGMPNMYGTSYTRAPDPDEEQIKEADLPEEEKKMIQKALKKEKKKKMAGKAKKVGW